MSGRADAEIVLRARNLEVAYGGKRILADVSLDIRSGEFWFLIGRNGTGKTTLLRAILGLIRSHGGLLERSRALRDREGLGFVPQRCELNPSLSTTVREFVSLGLVGTAVPRARRGEHLAWALGRAGLAGLEDADYWSLSGGQRQRALVARALVRRPELMILDEPTEGLDVATEDALLRTLADLNRDEATTLLFVTHKLSTTMRYATHVALFHAGSVIAGERERVLRPSEIERAFGVPVDLILAEEDGSGETGGGST